jgi:ABC-type lipoprotein export system ATPase subunit
MPLLSIEKLKKSFIEPNGHVLPVLDVPRYQLEPGEQAAMIGKSGCGKTTLLHIIAGITSSDSGSITLDGIEITKRSEPIRDRIRADKVGYVFQTFNLLPGFSAYENVLLGMTFGPGKRNPSRAAHLLDRVGLSHRASHKPSALSVGEQQRVAIARALANRPKLILADEPTANVDPANQQAMIELIRTTCTEEGAALILVTHAMEVADQFPRRDKLEELNLAVGRAISPAPRPQPPVPSPQ